MILWKKHDPTALTYSDYYPKTYVYTRDPILQKLREKIIV